MNGGEAPAGTVFAHQAPRPYAKVSVLRMVPLGLLVEPLDPMRHNMDDDAMLELQKSIHEHGLFQNLDVVPVHDGERVEWGNGDPETFDAHVRRGGLFRVAAGHRRLLACRAVKYDPVPCAVYFSRAVSEDALMAGENTQREDPSDFDLAVLYTKWLNEEGMTEHEFQRRGGKSLEFMYARTDLLQGYKEVADALHRGEIKFAVARALNRAKEPEYMAYFLDLAVRQGATAKLVAEWVAERNRLSLIQPGTVQPDKSVSTPHPPVMTKIECLLCGDPQSYNLETVLLCKPDIERIRAARAATEAAERGSDAVQDSGGTPTTT